MRERGGHAVKEGRVREGFRVRGDTFEFIGPEANVDLVLLPQLLPIVLPPAIRIL